MISLVNCALLDQGHLDAESVASFSTLSTSIVYYEAYVEWSYSKDLSVLTHFLEVKTQDQRAKHTRVLFSLITGHLFSEYTYSKYKVKQIGVFDAILLSIVIVT